MQSPQANGAHHAPAILKWFAIIFVINIIVSQGLFIKFYSLRRKLHDIYHKET